MSKKEIPFWLMSLSQNKFFSEYLLNKIESITGSNYNLERVYANGHTYGMKGSPHKILIITVVEHFYIIH